MFDRDGAADRPGDLPQPAALLAVGEVGCAVSTLAGSPLWPLRDGEVLEGVLALEDAQRRLDAAKLAWLAEVHHRGAATATGATSTAAWLIDATLASPGRAYARPGSRPRSPSATPRSARRCPRGCCRRSRRRCACGAWTRCRPHSTTRPAPRRRPRCSLRPPGWTGAGWRSPASTCAGSSTPTSRTRLFDAEQRARDKNWFTMYADPDAGGGRVEGWLDAHSQAALGAALRPLSAPMVGCDTLRDERSARQRRGDALAELGRRACNSGELPTERGAAPHVLVTMTEQTLTERITQARAYLEDGIAISAAEARRIACDANLIPVVLGARSEPLDVGRACYPVTAAIRRALVARDGGCIHPGCGRPAAWCDAHHLIPWAEGGPTSLANTALFCEVHHRLFHGGGWRTRMGPDQHPEVLPPAWHKKAGTWIPAWRRRPDGNIGAPQE